MIIGARKLVMVLNLCLIMTITSSCAIELNSNLINNSTTAKITNAKFEISEERDSGLTDSVFPIKADAISENGYKIYIVGASFEDSSKDILQDCLNIGTGLNKGPENDGFDRGFAFGFKNSSSSETDNKDAYLSLYLYFSFANAETAQRDSIIPKLDIKGKDDKGEKVDLIYVSRKGKYIDVDYPYAVAIMKTYKDAVNIELKINGVTYDIDTDLLKK